MIGALALYGLGALLGRGPDGGHRRQAAAGQGRRHREDRGLVPKHGKKTVFFGRMIPIFRSLISIPAGVERMPVMTFTLLTTAGQPHLEHGFVMAGYCSGEN